MGAEPFTDLPLGIHMAESDIGLVLVVITHLVEADRVGMLV